MSNDTAPAPAPAPATAPTRVIPGLVADPRPLFARAIALARTTIDGVRDDQLAGPTPCDQLDVRALVTHQVEGVQRVAELFAGRNPLALPGVPEGVDFTGLRSAFSAAAQAASDAFAADEQLDAMFSLPWATMPGRAHLATYTNEVTVHTWDLAVATGQHPAWDPEVLALADTAIHAAFPPERATVFDAMFAGMPESVRPAAHPWRDALPADEAAAPIDRLVAYNGRDPRWRPAA